MLDNGQATLVDVEEGAEEAPTEGSGSETEPHRPENVTVLECSEEVAQFREEMDDAVGWGYAVVKLAQRSTLSGMEARVQAEKKLETPKRQSWGIGFRYAKSWAAGLICWYLGLLSTPLAPPEVEYSETGLRVTPKENFKIFFPDALEEAKPDLYDELVDVQDRFEAVDEHHADETDIELQRKRRAFSRKRFEKPVRSRKEAIAAEIRARVGFTSKYGHEVPDRSPEFDGVSLEALADRLDAVREFEGAGEERQASLSERITQRTSEWKTEVVHEHFEEYAGELLE